MLFHIILSACNISNSFCYKQRRNILHDICSISSSREVKNNGSYILFDPIGILSATRAHKNTIKPPKTKENICMGTLHSFPASL